MTYWHIFPFGMYGLQQGYGNNGSDGMMEKGHNRKASESLRRPISFF